MRHVMRTMPVCFAITVLGPVSGGLAGEHQP